jgi:hypothetical protein
VVACAALHPPVVLAVMNPQDGFDDGGIGHVPVLAWRRLEEGGWVIKGVQVGAAQRTDSIRYQREPGEPLRAPAGAAWTTWRTVDASSKP